jgi:outer membrane lipoprotein-sorting protein
MKTITTASLISIFLFSAYPLIYSQEDGSGKLLDEFSEKIRSAPSVSMDFTIAISSPRDEFSDEFDGHLVMKGEKYRIDVMGTETWFDGKSIYTYMPDVNEVMISDPDEDGGLMSNPANLFTFYKEEFKTRLTGEVNRDGRRLYEIDLHPVDMEHEFHTIKLLIYRDSKVLHSAVIAGKDGNRYTFNINDFNDTRHIPDSHFTFNIADHPGVEVIDMRW